jgi:aromatic-L-amino-acid/L-tryptophan decarboxylase
MAESTSADSTAFVVPSTGKHSWDDYVAEFRRSAHETVDWIATYLENTRRYPVLPKVKPGELVDALPGTGPAEGEALADILVDFERQIMPAVTHWNHPGFLAYFGCTGSSPAILGEMIAAALNTNGLHWKTSPAVAELEQVTLGWLREWMSLPADYFGIIYDTASVSSMHALVAAREMLAPEARENGSTPGFVVYTSQQSHSSIEKGAIAIGIGQKYVRKIGSDSEFRMRVDLLEEAIKADLASGLKPMCIVATIGTTSSTSIDPVQEIAELAKQYQIWLHVDAAYAGVCAMLPEMRTKFAGMDRADSVVVNPHKWLLTNIDLSVFFTRHPSILRRAFSLVPEYLRASEDPRAIHLMDYGVPLGHRFRSLKFWFVLRYFGLDGIQAILRSHLAMAKEFAEWVDADTRFERVAPVPFSTICFRYKGLDEQNHSLIRRVNDTGKFFLSHTELNGRVVIRVAIGNLGTSTADLADCWKTLQDGVSAL